jgi:hypothetical protein
MRLRSAALLILVALCAFTGASAQPTPAATALGLQQVNSTRRAGCGSSSCASPYDGLPGTCCVGCCSSGCAVACCSSNCSGGSSGKCSSASCGCGGCGGCCGAAAGVCGVAKGTVWRAGCGRGMWMGALAVSCQMLVQPTNYRAPTSRVHDDHVRDSVVLATRGVQHLCSAPGVGG